MQATDAHVGRFLLQLGELSAGAMDPDEATDKIAAYAPLLRREFNAEAFGPDSLGFVAARCKFFPSYGELCGHLRDWWRENRPFVPALPAPREADRPPPTEQEIAMVTAQVAQIRNDAAERQRQVDAANPRGSIPSAFLPDETLLLVYEQITKEGSAAAAMRAQGLRDKIEARLQAEFGHVRQAAE